MNQSDIQALNELKILSIDMISRAGSGSPGLALSMAPIVYTLFQRHLNVIPNNLNWINKDRLVISSGNLSSVIYAAMFMAGYPIKKEDLMSYRSLGSLTPGLIEHQTTPGLDITSGLHGEGIGNAVGFSLSRRYYQSLIDAEDDRIKLFDYYTYCLCSDKDFMEGVTEEALSFAGAQKLDHLIFLYCKTNMTEDGPLENILEDDVIRKYQALGLYVDYLKDGSNIKDIDKSINAAKKSGKPALLVFQTPLGKESFNENKNILYNRPLAVDDVAALRKKWNLFLPPFEISKDSIIYIQKSMSERTEKKYKKWTEMYNRANSMMNEQIREILNTLEKKEFKIDFQSEHYKINDGYRESLRESNLKVLNLIAPKSKLFLGGSADSMVSSQTFINTSSMQTLKNPLGRNIYFGLREHAMASILNGMALNGLKVFGSTKLVYADYLKPALRMSAIMNLPVTYIFTHDTILNGEEGPVTQPIEQLTMLRTVPNLITYRPGDIIELMGVWENILKTNKPSAIVITKEITPKLPGSNANLISKGAYILKKEKNKLDGILISTGSELVYTLQIAYDLEKSGIDLRVVSVPSMELFLSEGKNYEETLLPNGVKKIVIEAGSSIIWNRFVTKDDLIIGLDDYGFSGHPQEVQAKMGFDYLSLKIKVENFLK